MRGGEHVGGHSALHEGCGRGGITDNRPIGRCLHGELERCLEVGLLTNSKHAPGIGYLELRVQINLAIDGVRETVQSLAGVGVEHVCINNDNVVGAKISQRNPSAVCCGHRNRNAVQGDGVHCRGDGVQEGFGAFGCIEFDGGGGPKGGVGTRQIQHNSVAVGGDTAAALDRFGSGQIFSGHDDSFGQR